MKLFHLIFFPLLMAIGSHHMAQAAGRLGPSAQPKAGSPAAKRELDDLKAKAMKGDVVAQYQLGVLYGGGDLINPPRGREGRSRGGRGGNINWATIDWAKIDLKRALPKMYRDRIDANKDVKLSDEEILVFRRARALEARNKPRPNPLPTPQNYQESAKWHRMAANQGHAQAQANLAILEAKGFGVEKDLESAFAWINIAMANGLGSHQRLRGLKDVVANELSPELRLSGVQKELVKARAHANQMVRKTPNLLRVQIIRPPDDKVSKPGTLIWKFVIGEESADRRVSISSPALGSDGALYFGANNGNVYSLESDTGQIRWVFNVAEYSDLSARGILPKPTIGSDGTVYLTGERDVFALDGKTGEVKWKFGRVLRHTHPGFLYPPPGGFYVGTFINSAPAIGLDGTVYLQANRQKVQGALGMPVVIALHPMTGKKIWESGGHDFDFETPVIGTDGTVFCGAAGDFFALDPKTGARKWTAAVHATGIPFRAIAVGNDGTIFVGSGSRFEPEDSGAVFVLNGKTGEVVGGFETKGAVLGSPVLGRDGSIYFGARDKNVYAYDIKTGKNKWVFKTGGEIRSSPAIGSDGTVYVGSEDKNFYALNGGTGAKAWELKAGHIVDSSPLIGPDGTIYIGSYDGKMYAITSNSKGPDKGPWPMQGQNPQRTGRAPKK